MKEVLRKLEEAERRTDEAEKLWDEDLENEDLEEAWNKAYKEEHKAFEELQEAIVKSASGQIDKETARMMILKFRDRLEMIINNAA